MPKNKTTILVILDGWGVANLKNKGNPITPKNAPNYFSWLKKYPATELKASGREIGLFPGQEGNSEAGHLNIGAGRVVKQDALYISDAIQDGTFFKNEAFEQAWHHVSKYQTAVHVMGLLSNHNSAHSSPEHLQALLHYLYLKKARQVYLHLFTDGRDSGQHDAGKHLKKLERQLHGNEKIATIMGRFYGMDRNKNWERTRLAYQAMVLGQGRPVEDAHEALTIAYNSKESDEFVSPTVIMSGGKPVATIKDNDAIFFFNLRSDRARQLTKVFVQPDFEKHNPGSFKRRNFPKNTRFVAMTDFGPDLPGVFTAFPSRDVEKSLVQVLCPRRQMYLAESEKYAHITYFFNGGYAKHFCSEQWVKVPSATVKSFQSQPEMKTKEIAQKAVKAINSLQFEFIAVNFASADMAGHTGNFKAAERAVKSLDAALSKIILTSLKTGGAAIITADHGNVEAMLNQKTGETDSEHSDNPVPFILVAPESRLKEWGLAKKRKLKKGKLADVAPTILKIMEIKKPIEMTGGALF